mgnify:CR=1 FL=1
MYRRQRQMCIRDSVVGVLPDNANVVVETGPEGNDLVVTKDPIQNAEFTVTGDTGFTGKAIAKSDVSVDGNKGETTTVAVQATFKNTDISNDGKGALAVNVVGAAFKKGKIESGKTSDSVSFDGNSRVVKAKVSLGKGNDSVTFAKGGQVKGKNTVDLGKGGKDAVVIEDLKNIKGTLIIRKFGKGDKVTVNGKVYTFSDRKALNKLDGIKIKG